MIKLNLKVQPTVPVEAECLSPDVFNGKTLEEIRKLHVYVGKRRHPLETFFDITGTVDDNLEIHGDAQKVKWVGKGMTSGQITVHGKVGMHLGSGMKGGTITVHGDAHDWVGAEMTNGLIHVHGNVGGQVGSAYRGGSTGMSGGTILIEGTAGLELGMRMKRGTIAVRGPVRDFAGLQMKGGTIVLMSGAELRTGAWMQRGTIISMMPIRMMPTFTNCCEIEPTFFQLYARSLQQKGFTIPAELQNGIYQRFAGDASVPGKGEILVWARAGHRAS